MPGKVERLSPELALLDLGGALAACLNPPAYEEEQQQSGVSLDTPQKTPKHSC